MIQHISVIICTHDSARWNDLLEAIRSVEAQGVEDVETVIVVDHEPALLARVQNGLPHVQGIANEDVPGASAARNEGARTTAGDLLVFLDDDAVARPDWLERLTAPFADPTIAGVGGRLDAMWLGGERPGWFPDEFAWVVGASYRGLPQTAGPVRNVWTGNMAVRRHAFDAAGGFRTGFGKAGAQSAPEDTDFCLRVRQAWPDSRWLYEPAAKAGHKVPPDRSSWSFFLARCYAEGRGKAQLSGLLGPEESMSSERAHARTLPAAAARELRNAALGVGGAYGRAAAILAGLSAATTGFVAGKLLTDRTNVHRLVDPTGPSVADAPGGGEGRCQQCAR